MSGPDDAVGVDAVLLDIEGVLVSSSVPIPGAADAVAALRRLGIPVRFLTSTTSSGPARIAATLAHAGIEVLHGELFTAAAVTAAYLREHHAEARCLLLNDGGSDELAGMRITDPDDVTADVVVVGGGGPTFGWKQMNVALNCLLGGAGLVAMHGGPVWRTADGFCLDGGAYARMLEEASGVPLVVTGKPSPHMFVAAAGSVGGRAERMVMVGDDLTNDVLAAQAVGMTGVLVRTGKFRPQELERSKGRPDHVVDSIADVVALVGRLGSEPPVIDLADVSVDDRSALRTPGRFGSDRAHHAGRTR